MDDNDIRKQIDDRKTQAEEREIFNKAVNVAYHLGDGIIDIRRTTVGDKETERVYNDPDAGLGLTIDFSRTVYSHPEHAVSITLEILEGEETVFLQRDGTLEGYVPGDWEAEIEKLQRPADRARETMTKVAEREKQAAKSERGAALRKAWGLSSKDGRTRGGDDPKPRIGGVVEQPQRRRKR